MTKILRVARAILVSIVAIMVFSTIMTGEVDAYEYQACNSTTSCGRNEQCVYYGARSDQGLCQKKKCTTKKQCTQPKSETCQNGRCKTNCTPYLGLECDKGERCYSRDWKTKKENASGLCIPCYFGRCSDDKDSLNQCCLGYRCLIPSNAAPYCVPDYDINCEGEGCNDGKCCEGYYCKTITEGLKIISKCTKTPTPKKSFRHVELTVE